MTDKELVQLFMDKMAKTDDNIGNGYLDGPYTNYMDLDVVTIDDTFKVEELAAILRDIRIILNTKGWDNGHRRSHAGSK